jgi:hypothetical protein
MTTFIVSLAVIALVAMAFATLREIFDDGSHANRQPPASHHHDNFGQRFGSV